MFTSPLGRRSSEPLLVLLVSGGDDTAVAKTVAFGVFSPSVRELRLDERLLNLLEGGNNNALGCAAVTESEKSSTGF